MGRQLCQERPPALFTRRQWNPDRGQFCWIKHWDQAPQGTFALEAEGLASLAATETIRTPKVLGQGLEFPWLVLEDMRTDPGPRISTSPQWLELRGPRGLGRGLARLHRAHGPGPFGWPVDNWLGRSFQNNAQQESWTIFFLQHRLGSVIERTRRDRADLPRHLIQRIPDFMKAAESILLSIPFTVTRSIVHGDLWSGNVVISAGGCPALIDPAVHWAHREVDLAMLCLFGQPSGEFWSGYDEEYPRDQGWKDRVPLYNSYHAWNHVLLFGKAYLPMLEDHVGQVIRLACRGG
jgi:protein-ribulosamine 3-kinase